MQGSGGWQGAGYKTETQRKKDRSKKERQILSDNNQLAVAPSAAEVSGCSTERVTTLTSSWPCSKFVTKTIGQPKDASRQFFWDLRNPRKKERNILSNNNHSNSSIHYQHTNTSLQSNTHVSKVHCGSALGLGASLLLHTTCDRSCCT